MTDICCIGHITRDRIITQNPPMTTHCAGGSAYYMAWAIEALPHDIDFHMITSVSQEVMPEVEKLRQSGIDVMAYESPTNVFFENGKVSGFIDLGDAGIADRWYDIALGYRSLKHNADGTYGAYYADVHPDDLFKKLGIEPDWERIKYYILLDELF